MRTAEDRRTRPIGSGSWYSEAEALGRVAHRLARDDEGWDLTLDQGLFIKLVVERFENVTVPAGCIKRGKTRWDRLHVHCFLIRKLSRVAPRHMARVLNLNPRYLSYAINRGRQLVEAAKADGLLDDAIGELRRLGGQDDDR